LLVLTAHISFFYIVSLISKTEKITTQIFSDKIPELSEKEEDLLHQVKNVRTTPRDQRFPSQNQALHCWNRYNEWLLCMKQTSGDDDKCQAFRQWSVSICPDDWLANWDEARDEGTFMGINIKK
jgi:cytochrome c oxidase subunit 6b